MRYVLIWSVGGSERRYALGGGAYFLGRLTGEDVSRLRIRSPDYFGVYLFPVGASGEVVHTGLRSLLVSRRHVKLLCEVVEGRPALYIVDHGPRGEGSRNGTCVNDRRVPACKKIRLKEGDTLRLSALGPAFMIGVEREGVTELRTRSGIPIEVPKSIANELRGAEALSDYYELGESAVIVLKNIRKVRLDNKIIEIEVTSEKVRKVETLSIMRDCLHYAIRYALQDRVNEALTQLSKLTMQTFKQLIRNLNDPAIQKTYDELIYIINHEQNPPPETIISVADKLLSKLQAVKP